MGPRGPILLEDYHLVEKLAQFDRERIPERVVHARGAVAKGFFEVRRCCCGVQWALLQLRAECFCTHCAPLCAPGAGAGALPHADALGDVQEVYPCAQATRCSRASPLFEHPWQHAHGIMAWTCALLHRNALRANAQPASSPSFASGGARETLGMPGPLSLPLGVT